MKLAAKLRSLREIEGSLRGLNRPLTQGELVRALQEEQGESLSQSYLSQIESGARPHLTNTSRLLLARFFKVHPGYLVDDPDGFHPELLSDARLLEDRLDSWLLGGVERFRQRDPALSRALRRIAQHDDSRSCLLLLEAVLETHASAEQIQALLELGEAGPEARQSSAEPIAESANVAVPRNTIHLTSLGGRK